ncbi:MAG: DNA repair exonuclease [Firmicutes bacterium]|nr:DNA repair exonuclease [Bacillota bacterium]
MARIRCLHLADLHLGWAPQEWGGREVERRQERDGLLKKAVDLALDPAAQIQLVLIAGDLFETHRPSTDLVVGVLEELDRLVRAGLQVVTVPGNHDEITYHDSVYRKYGREWPGLLVTNPRPERVGVLTLSGTPCYLYSLAYTGGLTGGTELLREFPRGTEDGLHVAVFHGSLDWMAGERSLPLSAQGLADAGYDYVALGHIHQHRVKTVGNTLIAYPGMVEGKNLSDPGTGFFTVVELGAGFPRIEKIPVPVRPYRQVALDVTGMDADQLGEELKKKADPEAVVDFRFTGVLSFLPDWTLLTEQLNRQYYHCEVRDETAYLDPAILQAWAEEPTLRGAFLQRMLKRMEAAATPEEQRRNYLAMAKVIAALQGVKARGPR